MSSVTYLTKDALEHLKAELQKLKTVERPAASRAIAEAREKGDLRENAEYDAAKESQGLLEAKIQRLEGELANARILDEENIDTSKVSILTRVTYPIGKGLLGRHIGDVAEVQAPAGVLKFKIENITT